MHDRAGVLSVLVSVFIDVLAFVTSDELRRGLWDRLDESSYWSVGRHNSEVKLSWKRLPPKFPFITSLISYC